jgi:hypothetical protein
LKWETYSIFAEAEDGQEAIDLALLQNIVSGVSVKKM